ncbi:MAG: glycoside hydrolase family 30 beta sandwich domain-containing protein [Candidatus Cloacimonadaceae bacterium]|nr:glycoside hydrolase family 30 beta sandwich domain-containing protein [Candidatus Cloacimonadaceae bacterium]
MFPEQIKQTIDGIGTSFTESSAYVLAHLAADQRRAVMQNIFGQKGANFSLTRTHIGSCDFSVEGKYSYADKPGDTKLKSFSIAADLQGFDPKAYPGIKDPGYDLLPMIKEALAIKAGQKDSELRIISSAWTAPAWMKDIETWYIPGAPENNWQGTGGSLKPEYESVYADYLIRYLDAYEAEGVKIWGITPVNEPHGNNGQWESMNFSPESQNDFIKKHLGPKLHVGGHAGVKLLIYDQNRDGLEHWADIIYADAETRAYLYGAAVHWYESTNKVYEDAFERVHARYPDMAIMHTEGCIDDLGKDPPGGVTDPIAFKESGWFDNDTFWWNANATDWAYSVTWEGVKVEDHPIYTPVHRYARNIIVSLDHWVTGWVDWNIVLDRFGGPNHVGNFCGAPIMIDTITQQVYYTPIYHVLSQFSRTIRPGDKAVQTQLRRDDLGDDDLHACATLNEEGILSVQLLNTTISPIDYKLQIGDQYTQILIPANSVQTVRVDLKGKQ